MQRYRIDLIGPFGLFAPDGARIELASRKSIALIGLLAASPNGARSRAWLQTMLWGSRGTKQAQASLRRELSNLASRLAEHQAGHLLIRDTQRVALALDAFEIDILSLGMKLRGNTPRFGGDFLEGIDLRDCEEFEDWLRLERERVAEMVRFDVPEPAAPWPGSAQIVGDRLDLRDLLGTRPPPLPPKPSLAILPLELLESSPGTAPPADAWLGTAMADELAILLAQYPQLFIVSSTAARELAARNLSPVEIAGTLGVRYLVEGNLRRSGDRLRVRVALLDGQTGEQVWAQGFDGELADLQDVERRIASLIAPQIWTRVDTVERNRGLRHRPLSSDNYLLYWRANALFRSWQADDVQEAIALTEQALENDPACPWAASLAGFCHAISYLLGSASDLAAARHAAINHYQTALRHGGDNAEVIGYAVGTLVIIGGDMAVAERLVGHSLGLLPAHQPTLFWGGWVDLANGHPARARERFETALRLNPATGVRSQTMCGIGYSVLLQGDAAQASLLLNEAIRSAPVFFMAPIGLCVAASLVGDKETALACAQMIQFVDHARIVAMFQNPQHRQLLKDTIDHNIARLAKSAPR
jgi:TolB-like protein